MGTQKGTNSLSKLKMLRFVAVLAFAEAAPGGGHFAYGHQQKHCHTKYNIKLEQACHEEYDVIVDTTYIEECQDIVTQHCQETSQKVHHSSAVVGHDSQVVSHGHAGHGYGKRDADAEAQPGYSTGPQCHAKKDRQCHKKPVQNSRKIPRTVCVPYEVKVPYEVCGHSHVLDTDLVSDLDRPEPHTFDERFKTKIMDDKNVLQEVIDDLTVFAGQRQMQINADKSSVMKFTTSRTKAFPSEIKLGDKFIEVKSKMKILGLIITSDLRWEENTNFICKKAYASMWALRRMKALNMD